MKIDKSKVESIDWLIRGISPKKLEREKRKAIEWAERYEKQYQKRFRRAQQRVQKADVRPCPHCRSRYGLVVSSDDKAFSKDYHLGCDFCHFCGETKRTLNGAIKAWNKAGER